VKNVKKTVVIAILAAMGGTAWAGAPEKCGGADIANGPFAYTPTGILSAKFSGTAGDALTTGFDVTAPKPKTDTPAENVFPGQGGLNECAYYADAFVGVLEIEMVTDASGIPLATPVKVALDSVLGQAIINAVSVTPGAWNSFVPGDKTSVAVTVSNPNAGSASYGEYALKLASKADGFGIGVGAGAVLSLTLAAPALTDKTPPTVSITKPGADEILGQIPVEILASDPNDSAAATGLASLTASVSSAGGVVSNLPITLSLDQSLTAAPGVTVTATGTFTPTGGTGAAGTTVGSAFTNASHSGIGNYSLKATAVDGAGNTTVTSKSFKVSYDISFTKSSSSTSGACTGSGSGSGNCKTQLQFTVDRSNVTSDGAFVFDQSVVVKLRNTVTNALVGTHYYGTGDIHSVVQINTDPAYQTSFKRSDIGATAPATYQADVYFKDVDGNLVLQKTSPNVTF
jgi:hypothetical protein